MIAGRLPFNPRLGVGRVVGRLLTTTLIAPLSAPSKRTLPGTTCLQCHHHLALELGPHVNLIGGTNGTGKSALLMALQCCLGARASDTGRWATLGWLARWCTLLGKCCGSGARVCGHTCARCHTCWTVLSQLLYPAIKLEPQ